MNWTKVLLFVGIVIVSPYFDFDCIMVTQSLGCIEFIGGLRAIFFVFFRSDLVPFNLVEFLFVLGFSIIFAVVVVYVGERLLKKITSMRD